MNTTFSLLLVVATLVPSSSGIKLKQRIISLSKRVLAYATYNLKVLIWPGLKISSFPNLFG